MKSLALKKPTFSSQRGILRRNGELKVLEENSGAGTTRRFWLEQQAKIAEKEAKKQSINGALKPNQKTAERLVEKVKSSQPKNGNGKTGKEISVVQMPKSKKETVKVVKKQPGKKNGKTKDPLAIPNSRIAEALVKQAADKKARQEVEKNIKAKVKQILQENSKKYSLEELPKNSNCSWSRQELCAFFGLIQTEIWSHGANIESINNRVGKNADDHGHKPDEGLNVTQEMSVADLTQRSNHEKSLKILRSVNEELMTGKFSNYCYKCNEKISFYRLWSYPTTKVCENCV